MLIMNNWNFIYVFECRIVNLATYRQFTNVAWDWIIQKKKEKKRKEIKITLSLGYPNSYFYYIFIIFLIIYKSCCFLSMPMSFIMSKNVEHLLEKTGQGSSWRDLQISHICNFYSFSLIKFRYFSFLHTALLLRLNLKPMYCCTATMYGNYPSMTWQKRFNIASWTFKYLIKKGLI